MNVSTRLGRMMLGAGLAALCTGALGCSDDDAGSPPSAAADGGGDADVFAGCTNSPYANGTNQGFCEDGAGNEMPGDPVTCAECCNDPDGHKWVYVTDVDYETLCEEALEG